MSKSTDEYGFSYVDCNGKEYHHKIRSDFITWSACLNDYIRFLESVFGYPIMHKVRIENPRWLDEMNARYSDWDDPWTGEYFVKEEDDENLGDS